MKTDSFSASRILLPLWLALLAPVAWGQTFYSPGGVGTVGADTPSGNNSTLASIFAWDISGNNTTTRDTYAGGSNYTLDITTGEFRVILNSVDINNTFWDDDRIWSNIITGTKSSAVLPVLTTGAVSAYTYSNPNFTLVNTSARGSFSLSASSATSYSVTWTAIPEPSSALAGMLLVGGLLRRRR